MDEAPNTEALKADALRAERELARLQDAFETDLHFVFEERAQELSDHLRAMLFELWMKARGRTSDKEIAEEVFQEKVPAMIKTVLTAEIMPTLAAFIGMPDTNFDMALADKMQEMLRFDPRQFEVLNAYTGHLDIQAKISGDGSLGVPDLDDHDPDDDFQKTLQKRLRREGLLPGENKDFYNWFPVFMNADTGRRAGIDMHNWTFHDVQTMQTYLVHDVGLSWKFPNPKPIADSMDSSQPHIVLEVKELVESNATCIWETEWDPNVHHDVVTEVQISTASPTDVVRATYHQRIQT